MQCNSTVPHVVYYYMKKKHNNAVEVGGENTSIPTPTLNSVELLSPTLQKTTHMFSMNCSKVFRFTPKNSPLSRCLLGTLWSFMVVDVIVVYWT
uniref:Uncharacterized protein n=1 Tax=Physcomitrium patens TaxID=3218 RepID=A0A2K1IDS5_PHYPA|nr:hypothetical protein PHYPA_029572 [Physcomitrium patens]